jgi:hypothetical protein
VGVGAMQKEFAPNLSAKASYHSGMDEPPADYGTAEALTPFTDVEANRLRRYVHLADELGQSRFFAQEQKLQIKMPAKRATYDLPHGEDDELVTAMVTRLRKLHVKGRPAAASFPRIAQLIRAHAEPRANLHSQWLLEVLDSYEQEVARVSTSSLIALVVQRVDADGKKVAETVSAKQTFYDWLYGVYLHDDEKKLARVERWRPLPVHRFNFLGMATDLARCYCAFSGIVRGVLAEPALVPSSSGDDSDAPKATPPSAAAEAD